MHRRRLARRGGSGEKSISAVPAPLPGLEFVQVALTCPPIKLDFFHVANRATRREVAEPQAAYGPPGGSGEESISVVAAPLAGPGFRLEQLGGPAEAGARFLEALVAPPGSGRTTELLSAAERCGQRAIFHSRDVDGVSIMCVQCELVCHCFLQACLSTE